MAKSVLGEGGRPVAQSVTDQIFADDVLKAANTVLTDFLDVVVAGFEFRLRSCSAVFAMVLDVDLDDSRTSWPAKKKLYHQILPRLKSDIFHSCLSVRRAGALERD